MTGFNRQLVKENSGMVFSEYNQYHLPSKITRRNPAEEHVAYLYPEFNLFVYIAASYSHPHPCSWLDDSFISHLERHSY